MNAPSRQYSRYRTFRCSLPAEIDTNFGAARTIPKAIAFDMRMKNHPIPFFNCWRLPFCRRSTLIWIKEAAGSSRPTCGTPVHPFNNWPDHAAA